MGTFVFWAVQLFGASFFGLLLGLTGWFLAGPSGVFSFGLLGVFLWEVIYVVWGYNKVRGNKYVVWERLGKYYRVSYSGITIACCPPFIDQRAINGGEGDFEYHSLPIEGGPDGIEVDFKGGGTGTPIGEINYRVMNGIIPFWGSSDLSGAYRFTYVVEKTDIRIKGLVLGALCQELQKHTVEEAREKLEHISRKVRDAEEDDEELGNLGIRIALLEMGVELHPTRGVVLKDIRYNQETIAGRQQMQTATVKIEVAKLGVKEAEYLANRQKKLATGTSEALESLFLKGKESDTNYSWEQAQSLFLSQQSLEVIKGHNSASLTLVGKGMEDLITSVRIDGNKHEGAAPHHEQQHTD